MQDKTISLSAAIAAALAGSAALSVAQADQDDNVQSISEWSYDELDEGMSAEEFLDAEVYDQEGDNIGELEDLVVAGGGERITGMVIETGGFLDIGDTHLVYPYDKAEIQSTDSVQVSIDGENVEEFSLFDAEGEPIPGEKWRITELIGDYAYTADGGYGWIEDVVIDKSGQIKAVVVDPDVTYGIDGYYAWPFYAGYYNPVAGIYEVPYTLNEVSTLDPFGYDTL
ncbi:MAG TPA: PRC-barrel domain-containing protein [Woeseiaceae bacterium]|nr:PRC-barrel domain-containing protein [Woeseiaceae bacterium]